MSIVLCTMTATNHQPIDANNTKVSNKIMTDKLAFKILDMNNTLYWVSVQILLSRSRRLSNQTVVCWCQRFVLLLWHDNRWFSSARNVVIITLFVRRHFLAIMALSYSFHARRKQDVIPKVTFGSGINGMSVYVHPWLWTLIFTGHNRLFRIFICVEA